MLPTNENSPGTSQDGFCGAIDPTLDAGLPSDNALIAFLAAYSRRSLAEICKHFGVPYCYSAVRRSPDGMDYGYTPEAKRVALQLQRLRKARLIHCTGMRWEVW